MPSDKTELANESRLAASNPLDAVPDEMPFDVPYGPPISLARAQAAIHAAVAEAKRRNWKMNIAVVDSGGNLVAFQRMDGAMLASIQIAEHKAKAAATFRRPTKVFEDGINLMHLNYLLAFDGVIASRGGIPLIERGSDYRRNRLFGRHGFPGRDRQQGRRGSNQPTLGDEQIIQTSESLKSNQPVSETNKHKGESDGNSYNENPMRTVNVSMKSAQIRVTRRSPGLLACHVRQPADQRDGTGNGPAVPGSHQRSGGRRASQGRGLRQRG